MRCLPGDARQYVLFVTVVIAWVVVIQAPSPVARVPLFVDIRRALKQLHAGRDGYRVFVDYKGKNNRYVSQKMERFASESNDCHPEVYVGR
jgi:signal transduction histidine kinase